ncbi:MAG TPA: GNAT family N-acetyltransferase [Blastocatellia bacterium]|nr:GNAT family N-acetyltransferase [Blastocatellia bacterium]
MRLETSRLELIAATADLAQAESQDRELLMSLLGVFLPEGWPPPLTEDRVEFNAKRLEQHPHEAGWWFWYIVSRESSQHVAVGVASFKGPPSETGTVEVGCSVLEPFQGRGYATEAVAALVSWAFTHSQVTTVLAESYPDLKASIRVLEKNGFQKIGPGSEPGVIRFSLRRSTG